MWLRGLLESGCGGAGVYRLEMSKSLQPRLDKILVGRADADWLIGWHGCLASEVGQHLAQCCCGSMTSHLPSHVKAVAASMYLLLVPLVPVSIG